MRPGEDLASVYPYPEAPSLALNFEGVAKLLEDANTEFIVRHLDGSWGKRVDRTDINKTPLREAMVNRDLWRSSDMRVGLLAGTYHLSKQLKDPTTAVRRFIKDLVGANYVVL
jgi:hypothetical protein